LSNTLSMTDRLGRDAARAQPAVAEVPDAAVPVAVHHGYGRHVDHRERCEAADLLRRLLDAVERGDLVSDGPAAVAVAHRLEGAVLALEVQDQQGRQGEGRP
jgi:hypothetical protein